MSKTDAERLAELQAKMAQLQAKAEAIQARQKQRDRKADTRRKVILGGALLDAARRDPAAAAMLARLVASIDRPQDRKAFDGWQPPSASAAEPR